MAGTSLSPATLTVTRGRKSTACALLHRAVPDPELRIIPAKRCSIGGRHAGYLRHNSVECEVQVRRERRKNESVFRPKRGLDGWSERPSRRKAPSFSSFAPDECSFEPNDGTEIEAFEFSFCLAQDSFAIAERSILTAERPAVTYPWSVGKNDLRSISLEPALGKASRATVRIGCSGAGEEGEPKRGLNTDISAALEFRARWTSCVLT